MTFLGLKQDLPSDAKTDTWLEQDYSGLQALILSGQKDRLLDAFQNQREEVVAIINHQNKSDAKTALHLAVEAGWNDIIPLLINAGANTELKNGVDETPLFFAVDHGKFDGAQTLLQNGAHAETRKFNDGITALQVAIEEKDLPLIRLLLDYDASVATKTPPTDTGMNAFHYAAKTTPEIMSLLLEQPDAAAVHEIYVDDKKRLSALRTALEHSDKAMVTLLLDYGVDVNEKDDNGETPLYYLLAHRDSRESTMPFVRLLIKRGADLDKVSNFWEETPLFPAVRASFTEAVDLLLSLGAEAKHTSYLQETPLHLAAENYDARIVKALISHGAELEAQNRLKRTPLHVAAHANRLDVVKELLDAGADPFAKDRDGKIPSDLAPAPYQQNVRRLLLQKEQEVEIKKYGYDMYSRRQAEAIKKPELDKKKPLPFQSRNRFKKQTFKPRRFGR